MNKVICVFVALCMFLCVGFNDVLAFESKSKATISEYEYIINLQSKDNEYLLELGYNEDQIEQIRSIDLVALFIERAKQDNVVLHSYGYTDQQIEEMRRISKQDEITIDDLIAYSAAPVLTITINNNATVSSTKYTVYYNYYWNVAPAVLSNDIIAVGWQAINNNGQYIGSTLNRDESYNTSKYVSTVGTSSYNTTRRFTIESAYNGATLSFPLKNMQGDTVYWAKSGNGKLVFNVAANGQISEMAIKVSYGHTTIFISPTVSFSAPPGISITFGMGTSQADYDYVIFRTNGTMTRLS